MTGTSAPEPEATVREHLPSLRDWDLRATGAQAEVWQAYDPLLGRRVAVKVSSTRLDVETELAFQKECAALGRLGAHEAVVTVHQAFVTSDRHAVLVMSLAEGGTLADFLDLHGPMPPSRVVQIGRALASALAAAHDVGILHLDVKPANILLDELGRPLLGDFGITELVAGPTRVGTIRRTPAYAAPEVLRGEVPTVKSDVWGLGATLAALLLGHSPFRVDEHDSRDEIERRILSGAMPMLARDGVPPELTGAIRAALDRDPDQRPDMRRLRTMMGGRMASPAHDLDPTVPPGATLLQRSRRPIAAGVVVAVVVLVGAVLFRTINATDDRCEGLQRSALRALGLAGPWPHPSLGPVQGFQYGSMPLEDPRFDSTVVRRVGAINAERVADGTTVEVYEFETIGRPDHRHVAALLHDRAKVPATLAEGNLTCALQDDGVYTRVVLTGTSAVVVSGRRAATVDAFVAPLIGRS